VTKILAKKIVSLYTIFFSKIAYLYRFKRYIFEYRCPSLPIRDILTIGFSCSATNIHLPLTLTDAWQDSRIFAQVSIK
jgi:hypothetical protein